MEAGLVSHLALSIQPSHASRFQRGVHTAKRIASKRSITGKVVLVHESIESRYFASNAPKQRDITTEAGCAYYYSSQQH